MCTAGLDSRCGLLKAMASIDTEHSRAAVHRCSALPPRYRHWRE